MTFLQRYMDSEIRAIMAQYMPLDSQGDIPVHHAPRGDIWSWVNMLKEPEDCIFQIRSALLTFNCLSRQERSLSSHWHLCSISNLTLVSLTGVCKSKFYKLCTYSQKISTGCKKHNAQNLAFCPTVLLCVLLFLGASIVRKYFSSFWLDAKESNWFFIILVTSKLLVSLQMLESITD